MASTSTSSMLTSYHLEHIPANYAVHVALFKDVKNADFLREQLLSGNAKFEYAFIDAALIITPLHALTAAFHALHSLISSPTHTLRTRNIHSETVFSLSPSNNITESFRRFGISPTTTSLLIIKIVNSDTTTTTNTSKNSSNSSSSSSSSLTVESISKHLQKNVEGAQVQFCQEEIDALTDIVRVRKYYKLPVGMEAKGKKEVEVAVLGTMALRGL